MATYTDNYHLSKPETTDSQQSFMEDYATNMEIIDENMGGGSGGGGHTIVNPAGTDMAQEPKMQFAGKVSVADDATNEKTVVTLPEEVKEVTLAEYEALPDSKLTDGKAYFIKDLDNPSVEGYPPLIYSDEEREVGVWRDGKPLYQKTVYIPSISVNANSSTNISISTYFANVDSIIDYECCDLIAQSVFPNVMAGSLDAYSVGVTVDKITDHFVFTRGSGSNVTLNVYLTLRYTKTTDTAGSGIWNGQGGYAHHYSTSETVIGTWIDGKPLYECTIDGLSLSVNTSWTSEVATNLNIKYLANATLYENSNPTNPIIVNVEQVQVLNGGFRIVHGNNNSGRTITMAVIQYTKTTD